MTGSFWLAAAPMAAAMVTLKFIRATDDLEHTVRLGEGFRSGLNRIAQRHGFGLRRSGPAQLPLILIDEDPDAVLTHRWCDALVRRGIYFHPYHNMFFCAAMSDADIDHALERADDAFAELRR